jgi:hypothetical protein
MRLDAFMLIPALVTVGLAFVPFVSTPENQAALDPHLENLRPLLGKTFKGTFSTSTPEKPMHDVAKYERVLNGQAVRVTHSVNQGVYGGETLIYWDNERKTVAFFYLTTAGFRTEGTMALSRGKMVSEEIVKNNAQGITRVRATGTHQEGNRILNKAEYFAKGSWSPGHQISYVEDPTAELTFK